jgi:oligopeptide transport system substrate-binding protein
MLKGRRSTSLVVAATSVIATVAACGSSSGSGGINLQSLPVTPVDARVGKPGGTFRLAIVEPTAIDPYNAQESEGLLVTKNIFDTLTTVSPDGKIQKQLAQTYNRDATCTTWTFNLKPNQKFSNGEAVDAESIKRGMTRAALGAVSDVGYHMSNVKGYDALQNSKATDPTKVNFTGVTATGDVLKVSLTKPDCEFDLKTAQPVFSPVPVEAGAASNTKYNDLPIGNGPFKMAGPWQHNKSITLVANDAYTDGPKPMLSKVELTIQDGSDSSFEYKGFKNGDFDYARINAASDLQPAAKQFYTPDPTTNAFVNANTYGNEY